MSRISGNDRYATAVQIAQQFRLETRRSLYVALGEPGPDGQGFADALAAAPNAAEHGKPLLLVGRDFVPDRVRQYLELEKREDLFITIVGGEQAVSAAVEAELATLAERVVRVAGETRYQTAALLYAAGRGVPPEERWLATGALFPDALTAGVAVALTGGRLLLVDAEDLAAVPEVVEALRYDRLSLERVYLLGGPDAISEAAVEQLREVLLTDDLDASACQPDDTDASFFGVGFDGRLSVTLRHEDAEGCTLGGTPEVTLLDDEGRELPTSQQPLAEPQVETSSVVPLVGTSSPRGGEPTGGALFRVMPAAPEGCDEVVEAAALLKQERRRVARVAGDVPIHEVVVGKGHGQVPLARLQAYVLRLPRRLAKNEVALLDNRLKALGTANVPLPKGPMPRGRPR